MRCTFLILIAVLVCLVVQLCRAPSRKVSSFKSIHPGTYPKVIYITYKTKESVPAAVVDRLQTMNPNFEVKVYGDSECVDFLRSEFSEEYVNFFEQIKDGPIKADFWRCCILYKYGGVYCDADVNLQQGIEEFVDEDVDFCTSGSFVSTRVNPILLVAKAGHPILKRTIELFFTMPQPYIKGTHYWVYSVTGHMYRALKEYLPEYEGNEDRMYHLDNGAKLQMLRESNWFPVTDDARTFWKGSVVLYNHSTDTYDSVNHGFLK